MQVQLGAHILFVGRALLVKLYPNSIDEELL